MENIDGYLVERDGDFIRISFQDIFGEGEVYTLTLEDARKVSESLHRMIHLKESK